MILARVRNYLLEMLVLWRPTRHEVMARVQALAQLPFLSYEGRRINGTSTLWRSFHFAVAESNWVVILHDQGAKTEPWVIFIERPPGPAFGGRFMNFERLVAQLPESLRTEFLKHADHFPAPRTRA